MSGVAKADVQITQFLSELNNKGMGDLRLVALDTEPTKFIHTLAFDIAFRSFNPFNSSSSSRGEMGGALVYEVISDHEVMTHIVNQSKIADAAEESYYMLINKLRDIKWYGSSIEDTIYAKDIRMSWDPEIMSAAGEVLASLGENNPLKSEKDTARAYADVKRTLKTLSDRIEIHYDSMKEQSTYTVRREKTEIQMKEETYKLIRLFDEFLSSDKHMGTLAHEIGKMDKALGSNLKHLRSQVRSNYVIHLKKTGGLKGKTPANPGLDFALFQQLGSTIGKDVDYLNSILSELNSSLKDPSVIGVLGHNIHKDIEWIERTIGFVKGAENWKGKFSEDAINQYCSLALFKRLESMNRAQMLDSFFKLDNLSMYNQFKQYVDSGALPKMLGSKEGKGKFTLEALFNLIVPVDGGAITQEHTAKADVDWTIDLITATVQQMVDRGAFKEGR